MASAGHARPAQLRPANAGQTARLFRPGPHRRRVEPDLRRRPQAERRHRASCRTVGLDHRSAALSSARIERRADRAARAAISCSDAISDQRPADEAPPHGDHLDACSIGSDHGTWPAAAHYGSGARKLWLLALVDEQMSQRGPAKTDHPMS